MLFLNKTKNGLGFTPSNFLKKNLGGFTLIELSIVVSIILILSTVVLANYSAGQKELALSRSIYKLAQDLRIAQELAMSTKDFGSPPSPPKGGYGIKFNVSEPNHYILFADCDADKNYDISGSAGQCFNADVAGGYPEKLEDISIEKNVKIYSLSAGNNLIITFTSPNPDVYFNPDSSLVIITLSANGKQKSVKVNKAGLIDIE